jgi:DNA polymerase-3 subunit gamma/tau
MRLMGGMRDALSILDQALSFGDGHVTLDNALLVTGSVTQTLLGNYVEAVVSQDTKQGLAKLSEVLDEGKDANRFVEDLISYARDLLLYTEAPELVTLVPDETFTQLAKDQSANVWYNMIDTLNETQQQLRFTNRPAIYLEVLTVKLSQPTSQGGSPSVSSAEVAHVTPVSQPVQPSVQPVIVKSTPAPEQSKTTVEDQPKPSPEPTAMTGQRSRVAPHVSDDQAAVFGVLSEALVVI